MLRRKLTAFLPVVMSLIVAKQALVCGEEPDPAPKGTFSIAVIPDTQRYRPLNEDRNAWENPTFDLYTDWISRNLRSQRIAFVSHVGDIVDLNERSQWEVARRCMDRLHGHVPYGISVGNHDMQRAGDSSLFQEFFPRSRFEDFPWYGGCFEGPSKSPGAASVNNANSFQTFTAEGLKFLIVHLECNAPDEVLAWADEVLRKHADRRAIITTHMRLGPRDRPQNARDYFDAPKCRMTWKKCHAERGNTPQQMWDKCFRRHRHVFLICCGDQSRTQAMRQVSLGVNGNPVHELLSDYGTNGLRLMRFLPAINRIEVRTWNPIENRLTRGTKIVPEESEHQFNLAYRMTNSQN